MGLLATFGNGCFWCTEAIFQQLKGVLKVKPGYSGGIKPNPTYQEVCQGNTGHAEVLQITYNPVDITYQVLLDVFWNTHDPTTLNRQGNDVGTQYRSIIFYHNDDQREMAVHSKMSLQNSGIWKEDIVTEIVPAERFYPAESYHDDYFMENQNEPYCSFLIKPKVEKFRTNFQNRLK